MSSKLSCEMEATFASARVAALQYAHSLLPECEREDCADQVCLQMRLKSRSDERYTSRLHTSLAFVRHCASQYVIDYVREISRRQEVSLSQRSPGSEISESWEFPDPRDLQNEALDREAFWQQIAPVCAGLSDRARHFLLRRFRDGVSHAEIAAEAGMNVDAVSQSISRSLSAIRKVCDRRCITGADLAAPVSSTPPDTRQRTRRHQPDED